MHSLRLRNLLFIMRNYQIVIPREFFQTVKCLLNQNTRTLPSSDSHDLCRQFASFFTDKVRISANLLTKMTRLPVAILLSLLLSTLTS